VSRPPLIGSGPGGTEDLRKFNQEFKLPIPVTLYLTFFWTRSSLGTGNHDHSAALIKSANEILTGRGFAPMDVYPSAGKRTEDVTLDFNREINDPEGSDTDVSDLRTQANAKLYKPGRLPVIFVPFGPKYRNKAFGVTYPGKLTNIDNEALGKWYPFVILDTYSQVVPPRLLLHEMGHAAGLEHVIDSTVERAVASGSISNFMHEASETKGKSLTDFVLQKDMLCCQIAALAQSYFALPHWKVGAAFRKKCFLADTCKKRYLRADDYDSGQIKE
jgi:hypothetical protein